MKKINNIKLTVKNLTIALININLINKINQIKVNKIIKKIFGL